MSHHDVLGHKNVPKSTALVAPPY